MIKILYTMKHFLEELFTLILFLVFAGLIYLAITMPFFSSFVNIALFIIAIFVLLQACANFDKQMKLGEYSATTKTDTTETQDKSHTQN